MTIEELIEYYKSLLILQYNNKPKALGTIDLLSDVAIMDALPIDVQFAYDLDTAEGVQLDIIGKYANVVRSVRTLNSIVTLDDDDFRSLIKIAVIKNISQSSLSDIQQFLTDSFGKSLLVFDFKNMRMGYFFDAVIGSQILAEAFIANNLLPKPAGVQLAATIYRLNIDSFFGMLSYEIPQQINSTPFNDYDDYNLASPWLDYGDAITI